MKKTSYHVYWMALRIWAVWPDALFIIDVGQENIAIAEAKRLGIPVVGIVDTNCSPDNIDYIVPGNDDALRSIRFYCKTIADLIIDKRGLPELEEIKEKAPQTSKPVTTKKKVVAKKKTEPAKEVAVDADQLVAAMTGEAEVVPAPAKKKPAAKKSDCQEKGLLLKKRLLRKTPAAKKPAAKKAAAKKKPAAKKKTAVKAVAEAVVKAEESTDE